MCIEGYKWAGHVVRMFDIRIQKQYRRMKSWRKKADRTVEEQMIRQSAEGCCQIAQYQKLACSNKKTGRWEEENRGGHCQEMSQMSIGRWRRIKILLCFHSILQCTEIHWQPNLPYNTGSFLGQLIITTKRRNFIRVWTCKFTTIFTKVSRN